MLRSLALGGVAAAALSSGCCWRPFCNSGPAPALYNPAPAPLFPRLHPSYWATPSAAPAPVAGPVGPPPDYYGSAGGLPPGAIPLGAAPLHAGPAPMYAGPAPIATSGPVTVSPPPGLLAGPQFSPTYFGPTTPPANSTLLPTPKPVGEAPSVMPMK